MKHRNNRRIQRSCRAYYHFLGCTFIHEGIHRQFRSVAYSRKLVEDMVSVNGKMYKFQPGFDMRKGR